MAAPGRRGRVVTPERAALLDRLAAQVPRPDRRRLRPAPGLADAWDLVVYLDAPDDVRVARMAARDGVTGDPEHPGQARYLGAQRIYDATCHPRDRADIVVDNTDPDRPRMVRETVTRRSPGDATM